MKDKLGRNDLCWCGSGKKYKKCHLDREKMPLDIQEQLTQFREPFNKQYCMYPQNGNSPCSQKIIQAHTIQKTGGLSKIAQNNHVYTFEINNKINLDLLTPTKKGINLASTFSGFCEAHDNEIFAPIEKHSFSVNKEHIFLLGYRALCITLYRMRAAQEVYPSLRNLDKGRSHGEQVILQNQVSNLSFNTNLGLRDAEHYKQIYDEIFLAHDYSDAHYYAISFSNTPDVVCSACIIPSYDFKGNKIQDLSSDFNILNLVTFSIIPTTTGGIAVFSWIGHSIPAEKLVLSLDTLTDEEIPHALLRFIFEFFDNVFFSPSWWDALDEENKRQLQLRKTLAFDLTKERDNNCLTDDGLRAVNWKVKSRSIDLY